MLLVVWFLVEIFICSIWAYLPNINVLPFVVFPLLIFKKEKIKNIFIIYDKTKRAMYVKFCTYILMTHMCFHTKNCIPCSYLIFTKETKFSPKNPTEIFLKITPKWLEILFVLCDMYNFEVQNCNLFPKCDLP